MVPKREGRGQDGAKGVREGAISLAPRASVTDFSHSPVGSYLAGSCWVYAWPSEDLCVSALYGAPGPDDFEALGRLFALELAPPAKPHAALIDARRLEHVDSTAFGVLSHYVEEHREALAHYVTALAIVRPDGFVGAIAAGFYETVAPPYPVEAFADVASAIAWAGVGGRNLGRDLENTLAALVAAASALPDVIRDVRRVIEARLPEASIDKAASDLGVAPRTLQRRLGAADTTFRAELANVQVARAKHWLTHTDAAITRIAYEVGVSTPQHLSALFRKATGQTPTEYRGKTT